MSVKKLIGAVLVGLVGGSAFVQGQVAAPVPPRDVVILALESAKQSTELATLRLAVRLFGRSGNAGTIKDVQMNIVRQTAPFGPVLLLAPDEDTRSDITANCIIY